MIGLGVLMEIWSGNRLGPSVAIAESGKTTGFEPDDGQIQKLVRIARPPMRDEKISISPKLR
jgi:hypothetical protein